MKESKRLGIYMNYQQAHLIDFSTELLPFITISSTFSPSQKEAALKKSEKGMHYKEQHEQHLYFNKIIDAIKTYDEVLLFGPTKAKEALHNLLLADAHFSKVDITVLSTDAITPVAQQHFVTDFFSKKLV